MSDFAWIAFILIVYMVVIRPMVQGILNQDPKSKGNTYPPKNTKSNKHDDDYVDYEEIK